MNNKYTSRTEMIQQLPSNMKIAEIGVFKGDFSKEILQYMLPCELYLIDLFEGNAHSGDKDGLNVQYVNLSDEYSNVLRIFSENKNVHVIKNYSHNALGDMSDDYLDFAYIDGDHSYEGVKRDLEMCRYKVKHEGYIAGHDYHESRFPGIVKAVNEFCKEYDLQIVGLTQDGLPSFLIKNIKQ